MAGNVKLMTSAGGGVILQPSGNTASDVTVNLPVVPSTLATTVDAANFNGFKNRLINGAFQIWQRGTSFTASSSIAYYADRWSSVQYAGSLATISRQSSGLTGVTYCIRCQRPAGATNTATINMSQSVETENSIDLAGNSVTFSFWARAGSNFSSTSNILVSQVISGTGIDQNVFSTYTGAAVSAQNNTLTTSWQKFTQTVTLPSNATEVAVLFYYSPTGTAGSNDYYEVTLAQLEKGSIATNFDYRDFGTELTRCQRYFEKSFSYETAPAHDTGGLPVIPIGGNLGCGGNSYWTIPFKVNKRISTYAVRWYDPIGAHSNSENWVRYITACNTGDAVGPNSSMSFNSNTTSHLAGYSQVGTAVPPIFYWTADAEL